MTRNMQKPMTCQECGKIVMLQPRRWPTFKYCSRSCKARASVDRLNTTRRKAVSNPSWFKAGVPAHNRVASLAFTCKHCGKSFERKPWQTTRQGTTNEYCSAQCRNEYRSAYQSGPNSPLWVGGANSYRGRNWAKIRLIVVDHQAGNCAHCGKHLGSRLPVHHITPSRTFARREDANTLDNLIGLCQSCHLRFEKHSIKVPGVPEVPASPYTRTCMRCHQEFVTASMSQRNCDECWYATCEYCGNRFRKWAPSDNARYCSHKCGTHALWASRRELNSGAS